MRTSDADALHGTFTETCDDPTHRQNVLREHAINIRTTVASALLILSGTCALASPPPATTWTPLTTRAHAIDTAAQRGDWTTARRFSNDLTAQWTVKRPTALNGLKGRAYAESFDASLKWISSAVTMRDAVNVHQAAAFVERTVHELEERAVPQG